MKAWRLGMTAERRNWNRAAELSRKGSRSHLEELELRYRYSVQNFVANHGGVPVDFVEPGEVPAE